MNYLLLVGYLFVLSILEIKRVKLDNKYWIISIVLLICFATFRSDDSYDIVNYKNFYDEIDSIYALSKSYMEFGFSLLSLLFRTLKINFYLFLLFINTVSICVKSYVIKKTFCYRYLPLLLYAMSLYMNYENAQIRSGVALAFFMLAIMFWQDKRKYYLFSIIAISFHISALVLLILPFYLYLYNKICDMNNSKKIIAVVFLILIVISKVNWFDILLFINKYTIHSEYLLVKLTEYRIEPMGILNFSFFTRVILLCGIYKLIISKYKLEKNTNWKIYTFNVVFYLVFNSIPILIQRSGAMLRIFDLYYASIMIKECFDNRNEHTKTSRLRFVFVLFFILIFLSDFLVNIVDPHYFGENIFNLII